MWALNMLFKDIVCLLLLVPCLAQAGNLYQHPLKDLRTTERVSLSQLSASAKVVVVFQPECDWCEKQIDDLEQLQHQCENELTTVAVGSRGKRAALKRELKRYHKSLPALQADGQFIRALGGVVATPVTLFFDSNGELLAKRRGYMAKDKLRKVINIQTKSQCAS
jgi:thioredoxin-related protein